MFIQATDKSVARGKSVKALDRIFLINIMNNRDAIDVVTEIMPK